MTPLISNFRQQLDLAALLQSFIAQTGGPLAIVLFSAVTALCTTLGLLRSRKETPET